MRVNVKRTWLVTRAAVPLLRDGAGDRERGVRHSTLGRAA